MRILIQQPRLPHYRVPLIQRIVHLHRWEVTVGFTPRGGAGESGLEVAEWKGEGVNLMHFPLRVYRLGGLSLHYQHGLLPLLRSQRWDALFLEGAQANLSGYLAARWCRRHRIPCIWWTKGYFTPQNALRRFLHRLQLREPHAFLPYGDATHEFLKQYGVRAEQIVRAYNTVDVESIVHQRESLRKHGQALRAQVMDEQAENPLIVYVGRLTANKRVADLLRSVPMLHRMGLFVTLLIVGDGPERPMLETLAEELAVRKWVYFTGRVPEAGDSAALAVADVAVFPGAHGLAINQAMALGTPVVVADLPGPDGEMVVHQQTGWRFPKGDIEALAEAVRDALHSAIRTAIVQRAQQEILQRRNLTQYANAFAEAVIRAQQFCR